MAVEEADQRAQQLPLVVGRPRMHRRGELAIVVALQGDPAGVAGVGPLLTARLARARPVERAAALAAQLTLLVDEQAVKLYAGTRDHGEPDHAACPPRV